MKKGFVFYVLASLITVFPAAGCRAAREDEYRFYENAAAYRTGEFTCAESEVRRVEIDWLGGSVEVEQSNSDQVCVFEEENGLPEQKRLHTYLNEGVLHIKYCRSGCLGKIDEMQKDLQVDIPKGVDVEINSVSANVYLGVLETGDISVETDSGNVEAESLTCQTADIDTKSGYVGIGALTAQKAELDTRTGDIHLVLPTCQDVEIETKRGDVTLYLQGDVCALIDFETRKGNLKSERQYERKGNEYFFALGDGQISSQGTRRILVETGSGNLCVE